MPNSIKAAKEILKAAAAEAALSEEKSVKWDLGKRWDCMQSIEKQQQKLSKMGVHSILIMVAENPRKEPTRKISTTGGFADLIQNGQVGKAFALECLKFTPKCKLYFNCYLFDDYSFFSIAGSNDVNYKEKRKRTHSQTTLEKSDVPVEENNMPVEESCANIEVSDLCHCYAKFLL